MRCPACGRALVEVTVADVKIDACRGGCGGLWFDHLEIRKLDDRDEAAGEALLDVERRPDARVDHAAPRSCPRCRHQALTRHFYSPRREVEVDECPRCAGFWLDAGELAAIRDQYPSGAARKEAYRQFAQDLFRAQVREVGAEIAAESRPVLTAIETVGTILRFLWR